MGVLDGAVPAVLGVEQKAALLAELNMLDSGMPQASLNALRGIHSLLREGGAMPEPNRQSGLLRALHEKEGL
jgi:hypothetical protein